ncbi:hypothetical protein C8R43DRAFT_957964 [Mycena crocata]|nr:hypothetical protein C8R43DRAFT_957964 [Mycena crocata]
MPPQPTQSRLNKTLTALDAAVTTLEMVNDSLQAPFLGPICITMRSLLATAQGLKKNQDSCTQMLEQIHELMYATIRLHISSGTGSTGGELSPTMLDNLGRFTETLHKTHTFVEAQREKSKIKQFFRQGEMNALLKSCNVGLEHALHAFKVQHITNFNMLSDAQESAQKTQKEVLDFISDLSDKSSSDSMSYYRFVYPELFQLKLFVTVTRRAKNIPWP